MDYAANSHKGKKAAEKKERPKIDPVVKGEVVNRKPTPGRRFKEIFFGGEAKGVIAYVAGEVLLPAFRNLLVDASTEGIRRMVYGESTQHHRSQMYSGRTTYNSPVRRSESRYSRTPPPPTYSPSRRSENDIILATREDAEEVLERLGDIVEAYEFASVGDLYELCGLPVAHVDQKYGWISLQGAGIRQIREGYLLDLPPAQAY